MSKRRRIAIAGAVCGALAAALVVGLCAASRLYRIPSGSMRPALLPGDVILTNTLPLALGGPERWDVLVFHRPPGEGNDGAPPEMVYVKRLAGLPEETVLLAQEGFRVNGAIHAPPAEVHWNQRGFYAVRGEALQVPEGRYFFLGDNGMDSRDGRYWGTVRRKDLLGRALLVVWPPERWGWVR